MASDKETIRRTAEVWVECGGDAEGLWFKVRELCEEVKRLLEEKRSTES